MIGLLVLLKDIFDVVIKVYQKISGVYVVVVVIIGLGMVVFCDFYGICLLVLGKCVIEMGDEYMVVFESVVLDVVGFKFICDVVLGEVVFVIEQGELFM